jgi:hypothetical protein
MPGPALGFARDDPAAVIAAVAPVRDSLGMLASVEPGLLGFWPAYVHALVRSGKLDEAEQALFPCPGGLYAPACTGQICPSRRYGGSSSSLRHMSGDTA